MSIVIGNKTVAGIHIANKEVQRITIGGKIAYEMADYFYIENEYNGLNTITLKKNGSPTTGTTLEWSGDLVTWTTVTYNADNEFLIGIPYQNQKIYFRSSDGLSSSNTDRYTFSATENHAVGGDARTLIDYTDSTLNTAPAWCFRSLFEGDSTLVDISNFNLSRLINVSLGCYRGIFATTGITDASMLYLPAMTLAEDCYRSLFYHCYSLVHAPEFPATTLATNCYRSMFAWCSSLVEAPEFPATTLATEAYVDLFNGCSLIDKITTYIQNWNTTDTTNWVKNVAASGTFVNLGGATITTGDSGIPTSWTELKSKALSFTNKSSSSNTLTLTRYNSNGQCPTVVLEYSTDGVNWQEWQAVNDVRTYTIPANGTIYLRGNNTAFGQNANGTDYHQFASTRNIEAHGNIMTLLDKTGSSTTITSTGCFRSLFRNMTTLKTAPELPATTLNNAAYVYMFINTGITEAPKLPATRIGNGYYYGMFQNCTSLTKAAKMTINEFISGHVNACREMYYGCSALTDISGITINTTNFTSYAFKTTFKNCTSLTNAVPMTIAQVGEFTFDSTYEGCSALIDVSRVYLNATNVPKGAYKIMFKNTAITTAPEIMATSLYSETTDRSNGSLSYMFQNCSNLRTIKVHFSNWNDGAGTHYWCESVAATGDFYNLGGATISSGRNGIPSGWTEHKGTIKIKWYDDNQMKYTLPSEWDRSNNGKVVGIAVQDNSKNISYTVATKWARYDTPDTGGVNGNAMVYGDNTVSVSGVTTTTTYSTAISDYNGKVNTTALLANATAQPNWRTDSTITSSYAAGYQPAACCCWRFHTLGTNQGDWYLPSAGELNSSYDFRTPINNALLVCSCPILWEADETTNRRWSSTQYSSSKAWHFESGQIINWNKTRDIRVRPFGDY